MAYLPVDLVDSLVGYLPHVDGFRLQMVHVLACDVAVGLLSCACVDGEQVFF